MEISALIFALFIALLVTLIFSAGFNNRGPWGSFWTFFVIVFLAAWASSLWIRPFGPYLWNVAWLPILFVGFIFALLLAAVSSTSDNATKRRTAQDQASMGIARGSSKTTTSEAENPEGAVLAFSLFFWILLTALAISIIIGYINVNSV